MNGEVHRIGSSRWGFSVVLQMPSVSIPGPSQPSNSKEPYAAFYEHRCYWQLDFGGGCRDMKEAGNVREKFQGLTEAEPPWK